MKSRKVCNKTRSPRASLLFRGQGTEHTTVNGLFTYSYMQITVHPPDSVGDKNVDFEFPDACLFVHPFYFGYQDFIS